MQLKVTNSLNEAMFSATVPESFVNYASKKGLIKPFIKKVENNMPVYEGYYIEYPDFTQVMDQIHF